MSGDRTPLVVREFFRVRLELRDGYAGDFDDLAKMVWGGLPEVNHPRAMRREGEPWRVVLLTLDLACDRDAADRVALTLRQLPIVDGVEVQHVCHTIWSDARFLQRAPASASPRLYADLVLVLFAYDPIEIDFDVNTDEYEPEVRTIFPRLAAARSVTDVEDIVFEEFSRWFGKETVGPRERYARIAQEVWSVWERSLR